MGLLDNMMTNPLAMASLGLLSMPTRSREPLNPIQFAMQGAMGAQRLKQAQADQAMQQQQFAESMGMRREEMGMRRGEMAMRQQMTQAQLEQEAQQLAAQQAQQQATEQAIAALPPDEQAIARMNPQAFAQARARQMFAPPSNELTFEQRLQLADARKADPSGYYTPIQTSKGLFILNNRDGSMRAAAVDGQPLVGAQYDPNLQGDIAGAKTAATTTAEITTKREQNMAGIGDTIARAREILMSGKPTQSTIGTAVDAGGRMFGATPEGAPEADQLRVLGGALVAKMPRMEGPQSNFDVQNYREMAGQVGDSTLPIERRLAALAEVERLYAKYADKQGASGASGEWTPSANDKMKGGWQTLPNGVKVRVKPGS